MDGLPHGGPRRYPISPVVVAAVLVRKNDKVLMVNRGWDPSKGLRLMTWMVFRSGLTFVNW